MTRLTFLLKRTIGQIVIEYIKQDIRIFVPSGRPNGLTEWAKIFCGHSWGEAKKNRYC